jgi:hyperosmotically inducible protein
MMWARVGILVTAAGLGFTTAAHAINPLDVIGTPKTLLDLAIEARSSSDIAKDNEIVLAVNKIMADFGTIKASTEIYEQRLLVTGLFDDKQMHDRFHEKVKAVKGVKKLYWHVAVMTKEEQEKNKARMIDWKEALVLDNKAGLKLVGTRAVSDVNYRIAADAFATVYMLGRARSKEEADKAVAALKGTEGMKKLVNYVEVRP